MPSKKNKASSIKSKNKKPAKASKPAKKVVVKKAKAKPVKLKKPAKPAPTKKSPAKKVVKSKAAPAKKAVKKPLPSKKTITVKKSLTPKSKIKPAKVVKKLSKSVVAVKKPLPKKAVPAKKSDVKKVKAPEPKIQPKASKPVTKDIPKPILKKEETVTKVVKAVPTDVFKKAEKTTYDVLAISNTIPVKERHEISASKIASISNSITNPIKKTDSYAVKPEKEPNGKYELEFVVHSSAEMLYEFLSTPSGLSEWFCDDLNIRNGIYTFIWDDQLQQARLLKTVDLQLVRFQWVDKTDGSYFEFRIQRDDLTNDIALIITDFADSVSDRESSKLLWNSQIEKLMHVIGSIF